MIHGVWLGGKPLPVLAEECISTWPEPYEIYSRAMLTSVVPWVMDIRYFVDAYDANHFAGASDVARLALLYELGGIYLDVDVEVTQPSKLLSLVDGRNTYIGREDDINVCGAVIASPPKSKFIKNMLDTYKNTKFKETFNGHVNGTTLLTKQVALGLSEQDLVVLKPEMLYPIHWSGKTVEDPYKKAITKHHWMHSWEQVNA